MYQSDRDITITPKEINALKRELHEYKQKWKETKFELDENNIALITLARNFNNIMSKTQLEIAMNLQSKILPILKEIKSEKNPEKIRILTELAIKQLKIFTPSQDNPYSIMTMLTPMEMRIASMIKDGLKSEDIARLLCVSISTVKTHRKNIRKKLHLKKKPINLASYFKSIFP